MKSKKEFASWTGWGKVFYENNLMFRAQMYEREVREVWRTTIS